VLDASQIPRRRSSRKIPVIFDNKQSFRLERHGWAHIINLQVLVPTKGPYSSASHHGKDTGNARYKRESRQCMNKSAAM
jgi:hypothetical protein